MNINIMGSNVIKKILRACLVLGFTGCFSTLAAAAGPSFTGLTAKADSAETVFMNPAGMMRLKKTAMYGNPQVIYTKSKTEFTVDGQPAQQTVEDDSVIFIPALYYATPINDSWSFGIGPSGASGLGATYNDSWAGRYLINEWSQISIGVVPSIAYRINNKFSVGFSLSVNYSQFNLEKSVFNGVGTSDGSFEIKADGFGIGGNLGILYEHTKNTRFGLVYRSAVEAEDEGTPEFSGLSPERKTLLQNAGVLDDDISLDATTPQSLLGGIFHDFDNGWTMTADVLWLDFSEWSIDNITVGDITITKDDSNYQDIWAASLGTTYALRPDWTLQGGIGYVSSGLKEEDRSVFSRFSEMWAIGGGVEHTFKSKRTLAVDLTYIQFGDGKFTTDVPIIGSISGEYTTNYGISLSVSSTW